jgi:ribonucleoside-diphosphate reductase alpha chain
MSVAVQYGVPVETIVRKFVHTRFEPAGFTENPDIPAVKSILDYIAKFLATRFLTSEEQQSYGIYTQSTTSSEPATAGVRQEVSVENTEIIKMEKLTVSSYQDAPACRCGSIMIRTGSCYTCPSCGENLGACS